MTRVMNTYVYLFTRVRRGGNVVQIFHMRHETLLYRCHMLSSSCAAWYHDDHYHYSINNQISNKVMPHIFFQCTINCSNDCILFQKSKMSSFISRQAVKTGKSLLLQQRRRNSSGSTADSGIFTFSAWNQFFNHQLYSFLEQDPLRLPFLKLESLSEVQRLHFRSQFWTHGAIFECSYS